MMYFLDLLVIAIYDFEETFIDILCNTQMSVWEIVCN